MYYIYILYMCTLYIYDIYIYIYIYIYITYYIYVFYIYVYIYLSQTGVFRSPQTADSASQWLQHRYYVDSVAGGLVSSVAWGLVS